MITRVRANLVWVSDVKLAKVWYERVLGFKTLEFYPEEGFLKMQLGTNEFFIEHHNPKINAAFHGKPGGRLSSVLETHDLNATIEEIQRNGCKIIQPVTKQFYGGSNAIIADPDGNEFVLIEEADNS